MSTRAQSKRKVDDMTEGGPSDTGGNSRGFRSRQNPSRNSATTSSDDIPMSKHKQDDISDFQPSNPGMNIQRQPAPRKPFRSQGRGRPSRQKKPTTATVTLQKQDASLEERLQVFADSKTAVTNLLAAMNNVNGKPKENYDANQAREIQEFKLKNNKLDTKNMELKREVHALRRKSTKDDNQLASMGKVVAQATRISTGIADDILESETNHLLHAARHWAFNVADNAPLHSEWDGFAVDMLMHSWKVPCASNLQKFKIPRTVLCQAMVGAFLREILGFKAQFVGVLEIARFFSNDLARELGLGWTGTTESQQGVSMSRFKKWQMETFSLLEALPNDKKQGILVASSFMAIESYEENISNFIPEFSTQNSLGLEKVAAGGVELARKLAMQLAQFTIFEPQLDSIRGAVFDPDAMQDQFGQSLEIHRGKPAAMCLYPGLRKRGDDKGENMHLLTTFSKAMVWCPEHIPIPESLEVQQEGDSGQDQDDLGQKTIIASLPLDDEGHYEDVPNVRNKGSISPLVEITAEMNGDEDRKDRPTPVVRIND
ncbi:MAG: hypothetical protein M1831_004254 [Alyxoria varia]|nr:MAG: hypothetical protein M1831_004254 [Alyxoria varia]